MECLAWKENNVKTTKYKEKKAVEKSYEEKK